MLAFLAFISTTSDIGTPLPVANLDLQIMGEGVGRSSRPWDKGGGGGLKIFFRPFGPHFGIKIRGAGSPGPSPGSATAFPSVPPWTRYIGTLDR